MKVYLIENLINGKGYVGLTTKTLEGRWNGHQKQSRKNATNRLYQAMRKHGEENFKIHLLEDLGEGATAGDLKAAEVKWIAELGTFGRNGYNMTEGGDGTPGLTHTEEARGKISEANLNRDPEVYERIGDKLRGRKRPEEVCQKVGDAHRGKIVSDETRQKQSAIRKEISENPTPAMIEGWRRGGEKRRGENNINYGKPFRTGPLSEQAKRKLMENIPRGEEHYMYGKSPKPETKEKISKANSKQVEQLDYDGNVIARYLSIKEAAEILMKDESKHIAMRSGISRACRFPNRTAYGYYWRYADLSENATTNR